MLINATEIIKQSWLLYQNNWRKFFIYQLSLLLPTIILSLLGAGSLYLSVYLPSSNLATSLIVLVVFAATIVFTLWVGISLTKAMNLRIQKQEPGQFRAMLSTTSHLIWPLIYTSILVGLIVLGGTLLFVIPGIIFSVWYSFVFYAIVLEEKKGKQALRASKELVVGRWWGIIWRLMAPAIIFGLIGGIFSLAVNKVIAIPFSSVGLYYLLLSTILNSILQTLITPLSAAAPLILYLNAKENPVSQTTAPTNTQTPK